MTLSAIELAKRLGKAYPPTAEQQRVIEADPNRSHLVIAGAGSGKTETMSNRVVWLIANGVVAPGEVLGLTFTRKAAGELAERIRQQVLDFNSAHGQSVGSRLSTLLQTELPDVSTYNAFAASIYRDHALRIGREPDAAVISEATAWQLAWDVVTSARAEALDSANLSVSQVTSAVLKLARDMQDNIAPESEVAAFGERFAAWLGPIAAEASGGRSAKLQEWTNRQAVLPVLVDLAIQFQAAKRARGFIEFADQIRFALDIITAHPQVADGYRQRYRAVLLDEYQDTSVVQTRFFQQLFAGSPVMAVGDPDQSIYGFRGASASNLLDFPGQFGAGEPFTLSRSWRNPTSVLDAANAISTPLHAQFPFDKPVLDAPPSAAAGEVTVRVLSTIAEEAAAVAEWMAERILPECAVRTSSGELPSAAVLFRAKRTMALFAEALRDRGIPVHVMGVAGVLDEPVIVDLVAALSVLADPGANSELIRVLSGDRWKIGARDIVALSALATRMLRHGTDHERLDDAVRAAVVDSYEIDETASLVDALDAIARADVPDAWLAEFSEVALGRMRRCGQELSYLRGRMGLPLADFVAVVTATMQLDIEAQANESALFATNSLEAFGELVEAFGAVSDRRSLGAFVDWLDEVDRREDVAARQEPVEPGTVQLLTVHGAKGLEWDYVAVPRLSATEFPKQPRSNLGWLELGALPWEFRGDAAHLPRLEPIDETDPVLVEKHIVAFQSQVKEHQLTEERRIAYVAVTRPKRELMLTTSIWSHGKTPAKISPFLTEIAEAVGCAQAAKSPDGAEELSPPAPLLSRWPRPAGARSRNLLRAAELVAQADPRAALAPELSERIALLVTERDAQRSAPPLPIRIPASRVKDYLQDPSGVRAELERPLPQPPYRQTRLGTVFHSWVERRGGDERIDTFAAEQDLADPIDQRALAQLQATFERSPWGGLAPLDVEREIHVPLAGQVFICKIDAVYDTTGLDLGQPAGTRFQIVDWKTGNTPKDAADLEAKQSQLTLYRLAYATHLGIDPAEIDAVFYFVADDVVIRPERLLSRDEFVAQWNERVNAR